MNNEDDLRPVEPMTKVVKQIEKTLEPKKKSKWQLFHVMISTGDPEAEFPDPDDQHTSELYLDVTNVISFFRCTDGSTLIETPFEGFKVTDDIEYVLAAMPND